MFNQFFGEEGSKRVSKWSSISLMLLSLFLLVKVLGDLKKIPNIGKEVYPQSTIMVSGTGDAYAIPDIASFTFSVIETGTTVKQAQEKADQKLNKALVAVRDSGVADKDIKTTGYNVYPKYEYSNSVCPRVPMGAGYAGVTSSPSSAYYCPPSKNILTGYEVNQTITVKVRDTAKVADLVTKIGGVAVSNISGVEFTVDNREQYVAQARAQAITEAKTKAKELAKELGVSLGKILSFNEKGNYPIYGMNVKESIMNSSAAPALAQLPQGETKITSDITITYEIR